MMSITGKTDTGSLVLIVFDHTIYHTVQKCPTSELWENEFLLSELWEPSSELWEPLFFVGIMGKNGKCPVGIMGKYPSELWKEIVGIVGPYPDYSLRTIPGWLFEPNWMSSIALGVSVAFLKQPALPGEVPKTKQNSNKILKKKSLTK
jgi:hypothetical protein